MGCLFPFTVDSSSWSSVPPPYPTILCTLHRFCTVGIPFPSLTIGPELSKHFAKYLSVTTPCVLSGNGMACNFTPCLCFVFGKASATVTLVGCLKCLDKFFLHSPPIPPLPGTRPIARSPLHPLPSWHLTAPSMPGQHISVATIPAVDIRSLYKNPPLLRRSFWLSLMPRWHPYAEPQCPLHSLLPSCHRAPLRPLAPRLCAGPYYLFLA